MRIVLDECVPRRLRDEFPGHEVRTVVDLGWSGKRNGELIALVAAAGFNLLVTVDRNIRFQQKIAQSTITLIVLIAVSNAREDLLPLMPKVLAAIESTVPGQVVEITAGE
ncbi:MAG TPA: DUF5615 family PIN-like protein [Pirellulaceae bacterium]|jgi:predicted nuclease of predicted toxin-antitoxin system